MQIEDTARRAGATLAKMSNFTEEGVMEVRNTAAEALREKRLEAKMKNNKKVGEVMNRLSVVEPRPRDGKTRDAAIPEAILALRAARAAAGGGGAAAAAAAAGAGGSSGSTYTSMLASVGVRAAATGVRVMDPRLMPRGGAAAAAAAGGGEDDDDMDGGEGDLTYGATGSADMVRRWLERDREAASGGVGTHRVDTTRYYTLKDESWKTDIIPEIMDGKNIADFVDADIDARLAELEAEENARMAAEADEPVPEEEDPEQVALLKTVRAKKQAVVLESRMKVGMNRPALPRGARGVRPTAEEARDDLAAAGVPADVAERMIAHSGTTRRGRSTSRGPAPARGGAGAAASDDDGDDDMGGGAASRGRSSSAGAPKRGRATSRVRSMHGSDDEGDGASSRGRSRSRSHGPVVPAPEAEGLKDSKQQKHARSRLKRMQRKDFMGTAGDSDRRILTKMPRHLFSGKRGIGSSDWR